MLFDLFLLILLAANYIHSVSVVVLKLELAARKSYALQSPWFCLKFYFVYFDMWKLYIDMVLFMQALDVSHCYSHCLIEYRFIYFYKGELLFPLMCGLTVILFIILRYYYAGMQCIISVTLLYDGVKFHLFWEKF